MNTVGFAFTDRGLELISRIQTALEERMDVFVPGRLARAGVNTWEGSLTDFAGTVFDRDALIFVGACGIAVRAIAPHVRDKTCDPAVLCVSEDGAFVIPLLSGHIGGANALARRLAKALGGEAVITTATDVNKRFSVDAWAAERGYALSDLGLAKKISAAILTGDIPIRADTPLPDALPPGLISGDRGPLGILVSPRRASPFGETLRVVPGCLVLGIGCRRGIGVAALTKAIETALSEERLDPAAVIGAATIDLKADEPGLIEYCRERGWLLSFYSAGELEQVPGQFAPSEFVKSAVGVDNVCERAALAGGGRLIVRKRAMNGVTVAVALRDWGIDFE